jgi:conjugal transfer ATP-binding protein TraC
MQGEYLGSAHPHLLFVGRRGQPFFWSPFENEAGNHNVAICGKSGSGKSVLLQEMCAALRGAGAKVVVIDDGRSFEHSVKLQGGRFVEFTMPAGFCLNPFSMIDDARAGRRRGLPARLLRMIKAIVGQMARHSASSSDTERGLIDRAVNTVWTRSAAAGCIDHRVGEALAVSAMSRERPRDRARALHGRRYLRRLLRRPGKPRSRHRFHRLRDVDLASREELRSVVLSAIMFMTSQAMTRSPRSVTRKLLLIDEAWSMLNGGSMGEFVETYARTCRKYGGALATATQSLNDYYKSDGATRRAREQRLDADPPAEGRDDRRFQGERSASTWTTAPRP